MFYHLCPLPVLALTVISHPQGLTLATKEAECRELHAKLHQTELNNTLQQDLLRHMMQDNVHIEADDLMTHSDADGKGSCV